MIRHRDALGCEPEPADIKRPRFCLFFSYQVRLTMAIPFRAGVGKGVLREQVRASALLCSELNPCCYILLEECKACAGQRVLFNASLPQCCPPVSGVSPA